MNSKENRDDERRLQELEMELDKNQSPPSIGDRTEQPLQRQVNNSQPEKSVLNQVANWFNSLPRGGKVAVAIIATLVGFSILRSVLQLVASLISLAIVGVVVYLVYKFFVTPQS